MDNNALTLPQNIESENALLGSVLISPEVYYDVADAINADDFYLHKNRFVWEAIEHLSKNKTAIDLVTVTDVIDKQGHLAEIGGSAYLTGLILASPNSYNAPAYAKSVKDASIRRKIYEVASKAVRHAFDETVSATEAVERVQRDIANVQVGASETDIELLSDIIKKYDADKDNGDALSVYSTKTRDLNRILGGGLWAGRVALLAGAAKLGKASANSAAVHTPYGSKTMGEVVVGDMLLGSDGDFHAVLGVFPQGRQKILEVTFDDSSKTRVTDEHLWQVEDRKSRGSRRGFQTSVLTTKHIRETLAAYTDNSKYRYAIPTIVPVKYEARNYKIDPYLMGVLLGDGSFRHSLRISSADKDLLKEVETLLPEGDVLKYVGQYDYSIRGKIRGGHKSCKLRLLIKEMGLWMKYSHDKFIPDEYLYGSIEQRLAVLQGLCDTDGYAMGFGVEYLTTSPVMARQVIQLINSLGGKSHMKEKKTGFKLAYRIYFSIDANLSPFRLKRKADNMRPRTKRSRKRIVSIEDSGEEEATCIVIDAPDHLYATDDYLLTHNTILCWRIIGEIAALSVPCLFISQEMMKRDLAIRAISALGQIPEDLLQQGKIGNYEGKYDTAIAALENLPIYISQKSHWNMESLRSEVMRRSREDGVRVVLVDHVKLLADNPNTPRAAQYEQLDWKTTELKALAKDANVAILAIYTLNSQGELSGGAAPHYNVDLALKLMSDADYQEQRVPTLERRTPIENGLWLTEEYRRYGKFEGAMELKKDESYPIIHDAFVPRGL